MAIHAFQGLMGAGKSCVAVNKFLLEYLRDTNRPIYTNLPLAWVGESCHGEVVDGVNTRTGEPVEFLWIVWMATKNHARRQAMQARIHFLVPGMRQPLGEDGKPLRYKQLDEEGRPIPDAPDLEVGPKHGVKEFWFFTEPNSVVFLDEVADIWPTEDRKNRPDTMKSYIRHHRHYKDDLYFFFQDKEDIDPDLRRKIQYLWTVRNSTKENVWDHWITRGIKWPVQFFFVNCYLGRSVVGMAEEAMKLKTPEETFKFWPWKSDFRNYWSFSQAGTLPGKKAAKSSAKSSDFNNSIAARFAGFLGNLGPVLGVLGGCVALVLAWWWGIHWLMRQADTKSSFGSKVEHRTQTDQKLAPKDTFVTDGGNGEFLVTTTNLPPAAKVQDLERVVLVTPGQLRTTKRTYVVGDEMGGGLVLRFLINGVELEGGRRVTFDVLFPGVGKSGNGSGRSDGESLRRVDPGPRKQRPKEGQRPAGVPKPG